MEEVVGFGLHFALLSFVSFIVGKYYPDFEIYSAKIFFVVSLSLSPFLFIVNIIVTSFIISLILLFEVI